MRFKARPLFTHPPQSPRGEESYYVYNITLIVSFLFIPYFTTQPSKARRKSASFINELHVRAYLDFLYVQSTCYTSSTRLSFLSPTFFMHGWSDTTCFNQDKEARSGTLLTLSTPPTLLWVLNSSPARTRPVRPRPL